MSRQQSNGGGEVARGAGYAAFLGAALIGLAVIIGIVLLQIGDDNNGSPPASAAPKPTTTTLPKTTTTVKQNSTSTTLAARAPSAVNIIVLNGGAAAGKAGDMSDALKAKGYTTQGVATDWTGHTQAGNSVFCRAGLEREGPALAVAVGSNVAFDIPLPTPAPPSSAGHDCIVVVGTPAG